MFRYALPLVSSLQLGQRARGAVQVYVRKGILVAVALVFGLAALAFVLVAGWFGLTLDAGFAPLTASLIMAALLAIVALLVFACLPLAERGRKSARGPAALDSDTIPEAVAAVDKQLGRAVQQVGPIGLLATAFAIGMLAGRR